MALTAGLEHASLVRPCQGERVSGDTAIVRPLEDGLFAAIVDVLGHGPEAHELALEIDTYLEQYACSDVAGLMGRLHKRLRGSRGAAAGLCAVDPATGRLDYVGTGNTVLRRFGKADTRLVSRDGVLGQNMRTPNQQTLQLEAGDAVLLYTDGITDRFTSDDYPGVLRHAPKEIVRAVVERFGKGYDDAGCIALRYDP
jgi:negative regulator of sigma-B (phosphoserine phosphatase)